MKKSLLPIVLIAVMAFLVFFAPSYGWKLRNFFVEHDDGLINSSSSLALENENLKAELATLRSVQSQFPDRGQGYVRAMVYSRYPMNFKNELLLTAGARDGIERGSAVTFGGALIGKIEKVFEDTSLALTIFDSRFQAPVRIGSSGIDALFTGGSLPGVTLMPAKSLAQDGEIVYSASPDFPYGLPIGEIKDVKTSKDQLFREAFLSFVYDMSEIKTVLVVKQ